MLTAREQVGVLAGFANHEVGHKLFLASASLGSQHRHFQRSYESIWKTLPLDGRIRLGEMIGNQGRARYGKEQGWQMILGSRGRIIRQGPDLIYREVHSGVILNIEAKGGTSRPKMTFGAMQGTNRNGIRSARFVLLSKASEADKLAAARLIKAAQRNQLVSGVVRTPHVRGKPDDPRLFGTWDRTNVAGKARNIERELTARNPRNRQLFSKAARLNAKSGARMRGGRGIALSDFAVSLYSGWSAYQYAHEAWDMFQDSHLRTTPEFYRKAGKSAEVIFDFTSSARDSAARLKWLGKGRIAWLGKTTGKKIPLAAIAIESTIAGKAIYEYSTRGISRREFYRRTTGPVIFGAFTIGGGIFGGFMGGSAGGLGAAPGAIAGANIGAVVAIPFQLAADWAWNRYYRDFDARQMEAVNAQLDRFYGLSP
ncbi:MAG: hypothetical protein AB7O62_05645 [Pirellulales bacterium]